MRKMSTSLFYFLQRIWRYVEPAITASVRLMPKLLAAVLLRALAKVFRIRSVAVEGDYGLFHGSPLDFGVYGEYLRTGTYSPETVRFLQDFLRARGKGTFLDIGANIGLTTLPIAKLGIRCIAFEPDPRNFEFLKQNVEASGLADLIRVHNVALFDRTVDVAFERSDWNYGDHRIRAASNPKRGVLAEEQREVITVPAARLDDVVSIGSLEQPLVIKVDTEGAEVNIVKGGELVLSSAALLIIEFSPYVIRRMGEDENVLIAFIQKHFLRGFIVEGHGAPRAMRFQDISDVCASLTAFSHRSDSLDHVDVFLAK